MKISREELATRAKERTGAQRRARASSRGVELFCLVAASLVVAAGLYLVYSAKSHNLAQERASALNLNTLARPQQLIPFLDMIPSQSDQEFVATRIYDLRRRGEELNNVGAVGRLRVTQSDLLQTRGLVSFPKRLAAAPARKSREPFISLLTAQQLADLKPHLRVREADTYRNRLLLWVALFFAPFYLVHLAWRLRGFAGDNLLLPIVHALCGIGLILMIGLRDPLRDTLMFADFTQGVIAGCAALLLFSIPNYQRQFARLSYLPLLAALLLAIALGLFGAGPGSSDAKVNLFFFQPIEIIRILLVFFLAGYFAQNWDALRYLKQQGRPLPAALRRFEHALRRFEHASRRFNVPRLDYVVPVVAGVAVSILLFFWLKDLGPALVIGCLFLSMYSLARGRVLLASAGLAAIVLSFAIGYVTGFPHTVRERVEMWKSPWDNHVRGGDQLADSLWSLSTGGATGTGLGLGDPSSMPAAHTDLIVAAFGEEAGALGILALYTLYGILIYRSIRIALFSPGAYSFFLVIGLALIAAYQLLLITGGILGVIPLSGVVSPFLSYGKTSMVANFALVAIVLSVSNRTEKPAPQSHFSQGVRALTAVLAALGLLVLARFFWIQVFQADAILVRPSLITQADGVRRYQYNPRLLQLARDLPKGAIFDRTGLPLASSDWSQIEAHRADYQKLGVSLPSSHAESSRYYPLGSPFFYLLGDVRTRLKQGASNTAFQESASRVRLQGYDDVAEIEAARDPETGQLTTRVKRDYRALIPLLRHRYEPDNPAVKQILNTPRDIHMSIDAALQMRVSQILSQRLAKLGKDKGAVVILDPSTGDTLAAVSYPWPSETQFASLSNAAQTPVPDANLLDRARFGLYPPGSSFKIVTAIAALRKDPVLAQQRYECIRLPGGRVGNFVWNREIRDDIKDTQPHGAEDMRKAIVVSCNAYFAQLGARSVGAQALYETAAALGISVAQPNTPEKLHQFLPQASYGQGQVVASPFQMARVAATIANSGAAPQGRWIVDETNPRVRAPESLLPASLANQIAGYMRAVVTSGTARTLSASAIPIAGKTGTAELSGAPSHAWFIGFAPYRAQPANPPLKQIAFAVLVENGEYGGTAAAPIAGDIVAAARQLGLI